MSQSTGNNFPLGAPTAIKKPTVVECSNCGETVERDEFVSETKECTECHDASGYALDECGCERCYDNAVSRIDFLD